MRLDRYLLVCELQKHPHISALILQRLVLRDGQPDPRWGSGQTDQGGHQRTRSRGLAIFDLIEQVVSLSSTDSPCPVYS